MGTIYWILTDFNRIPNDVARPIGEYLQRSGFKIIWTSVDMPDDPCPVKILNVGALSKTQLHEVEKAAKKFLGIELPLTNQRVA